MVGIYSCVIPQRVVFFCLQLHSASLRYSFLGLFDAIQIFLPNFAIKHFNFGQKVNFFFERALKITKKSFWAGPRGMSTFSRGEAHSWVHKEHIWSRGRGHEVWWACGHSHWPQDYFWYRGRVGGVAPLPQGH